MPILNTFSGGGGGIRIPLESVTNLSATPASFKVFLTWTDPVDKVATPGGELVAEWNYSIVVRNSERDPVSPKDGIEIVRTTSRNQYQSEPYTDELYIENGVTYHYAVFAVTTIGVPSSAATITTTPRSATITRQSYSSFSLGYGSGETTDTALDIEGPSIGGGTESHVIITGLSMTNGYYTDPDSRTYTFDASGTRQNISGNTMWDAASASFKGKAIFLGGMSDINSVTNMGVVYNAELSKTTIRLPSNRVNGAIASVQNHFFYAGGDQKYEAFNDVYSFDEGFTCSTVTSLRTARTYLGGASTGNYALFAGGIDNYYATSADYNYNQVDAYDDSLTRTTATVLPSAVASMGCGSINGYAIFAGGAPMATTGSSRPYSAAVTAYNASLTRQSLPNLAKGRVGIKAISFPTAVAFAGGKDGKYAYNYVDRYDSSLTKTTLDPIVADYITNTTNSGYGWLVSGAASTFGMFVSRQDDRWNHAEETRYIYQ